jgi:double-stranded uracil-DNA glycosylase
VKHIDAIPEQDLQFQFVRGSGPGGQNVNKVASAAQLRFDLAGTQALAAAVKARLRALAGSRVNADGSLLIMARNQRTQEGNRREALERLEDLIARASVAPKKRHKTNASASTSSACAAASPTTEVASLRIAPARVHSFAAVSGVDTRILILGSMPGVASLSAQQYYAYPRNQFWHIMGAICGAGFELPYAQRLQQLLNRGLGLWDVLHSCVRGGSLDAAIEQRSAIANDLLPLLRASPVVRLCCNGGSAYTALQRHFGERLAGEFPRIEVRRLPSTSPANAGCSYARKLAAWTEALRD